ncbi:MAG TPA: hypothetical protein VGE52_03295 [Pirellulales bacterium]
MPMRALLLAALLWTGLATIALAQAVNLAALTPAGAGGYLELREPARHAKAFLEGGLGRRVRAFAPVARWREQQMPGVLFVAREVSRRLGVPLEELRDDVFGGSAALAIWPRQESTAEDQPPVHFLILLSARSADALEKTLAGLDRAQKASSELRSVEEREHAGLKYRVRNVRRNGRDVIEYLAVKGPIAAYSDDETLMQRCLALGAKTSDASLAADAEMGTRLKQASADAAAVAVFDPRPWRPLVALALAEAQERDDEHAVGEWKQAAAFLESVEGAVASLAVNDGAAVDVRVDLVAERLPAEAATVLSAFSGPVDWRWAPRNALVVLAGRADVAALTRLVLASADEATREDWKKIKSVAFGVLGGLDLVEDVLAKLGPSGVIYVAPREGSPEGALPLDVAAAIEWRGGSPAEATEANETRPAASVAISEAFRSLLHVCAAVQNGKSPDDPAVVRSVAVNGVQITSLEDWRELPRGLAIAYTAQPTLFVVSTSVNAAAEAARRSPSDSIAEELAPLLSSSLDSQPVSHVTFLNLAAARAFLTERRAALTTWIAQEKNAPEERVERSLTQLAAVLELADSAALVQRVSTECVSLTLRIVVEPSDDAAP